MTSTINILQELDLCYEKNQLPVVEFSVEPNGGILNVEKALSDNPECWESIKISAAQQEKKQIILNCSWTRESPGFYLNKQIISKLVGEGFLVYYPTADGLQRITDSMKLESILVNLVPVLSSQESDIVKELKTSRERVDFVDEARLSQLRTKILESQDVYFYFINFLFLRDPCILDEAIRLKGKICHWYKSGIAWDLLSAEEQSRDEDWTKKKEQFEHKIGELDGKYHLRPHFLPQIEPECSEEELEHSSFNYVASQHPDLLKRIRHLNLASRRVDLIVLLNKAENLKALSFENCAVRLAEDTKLLKTSLHSLHFHDSSLTLELLTMILQSSPQLHTLEMHSTRLKNEVFTLYEKIFGVLHLI